MTAAQIKVKYEWWMLLVVAKVGFIDLPNLYNSIESISKAFFSIVIVHRENAFFAENDSRFTWKNGDRKR